MRLRVYPLLIFVFDILGVHRLALRRNRGRARIIWYHGVCADDFDFLDPSEARHLAISEFRRQLRWLAKSGLRFVTMSELVEAKQKGESLDGMVTLTFDDGFRNVVERAYPAMLEYGAKGCFYLAGSLIGSGQLLWTDYIDLTVRACREKTFVFHCRGEAIEVSRATPTLERAGIADIKRHLKDMSDRERREHMPQFLDVDMSAVPSEFFFADWDEIAGLDPEILEIGSHTMDHPSCERLETEDEYEYELRESKRLLEEKTGRPIPHFNYPSGSFDDETLVQVGRSGYRSAVTTEYGFAGPDDDDFLLPRISMTTHFRLFKAMVSGSHMLAARISGWLRGRA